MRKQTKIAAQVEAQAMRGLEQIYSWTGCVLGHLEANEEHLGKQGQKTLKTLLRIHKSLRNRWCEHEKCRGKK